jgi:hypothetical protein
MLARENIHEEHNPCAINIINAPCQPQIVLDMIPAVARPMCLTEEYAIRDFTSVWRMQINLVILPPTKAMAIIIGIDSLFKKINFDAIRSSPYLPSFNKTPAKTIEPATGASTCALGSQRWERYRGVFTKKAPIVIIHQIVVNCEVPINSQ